jgi:hypothetical protein
MAGTLQTHWLQLGVADQLVDSLIESKAERIELVLQGRTQHLRRQRLAAMVDQLFSGSPDSSGGAS